MKNLCIIPARGGSKRIPRKNIKDFLGKPIIAYPIEAALNSGLFDEVMVSTDDEEIKQVAEKYGAKVPFLRTEKNANDYSGTGDVVFEVLNEYKAQGIGFDIVCCLYATSPLVQIKYLKQALELLREGEFDSVFTLGAYSSPILRSYVMNEIGGVRMMFPEYEKKRSQELEKNYFDAGQFYWLYSSNMEWLSNKNSFGENKGAIILKDYEVQDIDEISDWHMAELKYSYIKNLKLT